MKRFLGCFACLLILGGCAAGPDVTLLGGLGGAGNQAPAETTVAAGQPSPAGGALENAPRPLALVEEPARGEIYAAPGMADTHAVSPDDVQVSSVGALGAPPRLKTQEEILADEAELRRLAGAPPAARSRGLWNSSVEFLKRLRNTHGEDAINKIEADPGQ